MSITRRGGSNGRETSRTVQKAKYAANRKAGLCIIHACQEPTDGSVYCPKHRVEVKKRTAELTKKHKSLKLKLKRKYES